MAIPNVVINGRFLDQPMTGVQRYALEICRAIDKLVGAEDPATAGLAFSIARPSSAAAPFPFQNIPEARIGRWNGYAWEQLELPWRTESGVIVNLCNTCPLLGNRNVTVVHDANVWLIPDNYSRAFRLAYHVLLPLGIRRSKIWVTVSQYSAKQLLDRKIADRPPDAIIGSGSDHILAIAGAASDRVQTGLPPRYAFALGSQSRNKNTELVRSLAPALASKGISVVIAGDARSRVFTAQTANQQSNVIELGRVDDADLAFLLRNCVCFLFPSYFEGFGIPPLEAMAMGAPVVSSNTSSLPEILGDAPLYCSPDQPAAWIEAITRVANNKELRDDLVARSAKHATQYRWGTSVQRLLAVIRNFT